jgi:beta-barrel assembly-enhancing protease
MHTPKLLRAYRRWTYPLISLTLVLTITLGQPLAARAINWADILLRNLPRVIQVVQLSNMSDQKEIELGQQVNDEIAKQVRLLPQSASISAYVNQVGQRLVAASDRPNIPYTFQVVDDTAINAFATEGGYVYVNRGLVTTADNEAQLAGVMAHEMGHIAKKHALQQMQKTAKEQLALGVAGLDQAKAVQIGVQLALTLPRSRQAEFEADTSGLGTLGRSGYAQTEMVEFMKKLVSSKSSPAILSSHPATTDRITRLQQGIQAKPTSGKAGIDSAAYKSKIQAFR